MIVYSITNKQSGKVYIGATKRQLSVRLNEHKSRTSTIDCELYKDVNLLGWCNFSVEALYNTDNEEEMTQKEKKFISQFKKKGCCYNKADGGKGISGYRFTRKQREKVSKAGIGRIKSKEERRKLSFSNKGNSPHKNTISALRGRVVKEESIRKMLETKRKNKVSNLKENFNEIKVLREGGNTLSEIAVLFGCSNSGISNLLRRGGYSHT